MGILDNLNKTVGKIGLGVKKTYDTTKLEMMIKNYSKEEHQLYTELGKKLYSIHRQALDSEEFVAIYDNIDTIRARMQHLDKKIIDIRANHPVESQAVKLAKFNALSKKESDLTITRTDDGIKIIRMCPECRAANSPSADQCEKCGQLLSKN